jgi:ABC-2 type transport system ATP-binding protein
MAVTPARMASTPADPAVLAQGLRKRFGATEALRGLDLAVPAGTVCGLLGPNGAGKTTVVRILATLTLPDGGSARVAGHDVVAEAQRVRHRIGLVGQHAAVDEKLTARDNLRMFGRLAHLGERAARRRADELLERLDLAPAADRLVKTFSGGMRRRLDLAAGLLVAPAVLFLDEPSTGLDPRSRNQVWATIRGLVGEGTTVLLTTQYLDEADHLADHVAVVDSGQVIASGSPAELKSALGGEQVDVVVARPDDLSAAAAALRRACGAEPRVEPDRRRVAVPAGDGVRSLTSAVRELEAAGIAIEDVGLRRPTLDEVFLRLTDHRPGDDEEEAA